MTTLSAYQPITEKIDEDKNRGLADESIFWGRVTIRAMGFPVKALDPKLQQKQKQTARQKQAADASAGGLDVEKHPELPDADGLNDDILDLLTDDELEVRGLANKNKLKNQLKNKLKQRFSMGLSAQTNKEELKRKRRQRLQQR